MIEIFNNYVSSNIEGLYAFSSCLGLSLVPVFLFIYTTVVIQRYYHEIEKEQQDTYQQPNLVGIQRSFSLVPNLQNDVVNVKEKKPNIFVNENPKGIFETRHLKPVFV